ncbi:MAG: TlpA family protein disulfide reductase, partial [Calditrichia bacterium]
KNLPEFTLNNLEGEEISLSDYRGKVVLVNFWATWCMPCLKEMPDLIKLNDKYSEKEFEVLGIVVASKEENVRKTVDNLRVNYPVLWGTNEVIKEFGNINSIPRTFILDKEGNIVEDISGMRDFDFFEKTVKKYLKTE